MAEKEPVDFEKLIEPLREMTGIDFALDDEGKPCFEGELSQEQENRLYGVAELDIIDLDISPLEGRNGRSFIVTDGDFDRLAYFAMQDNDRLKTLRTFIPELEAASGLSWTMADGGVEVTAEDAAGKTAEDWNKVHTNLKNKLDINAFIQTRQDGSTTLRMDGFVEMDTEVFMTGEKKKGAGSDEDEDPDKVAQKRFKKHLDEFNASTMAGLGAAAAVAGSGDDDKKLNVDVDDESVGGRNMLGKAVHYFGMGVASGMHGVRAARGSGGKVSDAQIITMIKIGVLEKNYDTLHFYDRYRKSIDQEVSSRAMQILETMQRRGDIPPDVTISMKPQDVKPWNYLFRGTRQDVASFKRGVSNKVTSLKDAFAKPFTTLFHGLGWNRPLHRDFAKAHDHKVGKNRAAAEEEDVTTRTGRHSGPNAGPA